MQDREAGPFLRGLVVEACARRLACRRLVLVAQDKALSFVPSLRDGAGDVVDVVQVAEGSHRQCLGQHQPERPCLISVVCAASRLHVGYRGQCIFVFQVHVHHILGMLVLDAPYGCLQRLPFIHFQFFHREVRQVFHQHLFVAPEERPGVECQFVYLPAVDEYLARIRHPCAGQLLYQVLQHRTFGQLESRGVIDQRVTAHLHLDARGLHHHLVQTDGLHNRLTHVDHRHLERIVLVSFGDVHLRPAVLIAILLHPHQVVAGLSRHADVIYGGYVNGIVSNLMDLRIALHHRAVFAH